MEDVSPQELTLRINALVEQRNTALDQVVVLIAKLNLALSDNERLKSENERQTPKEPTGPSDQSQ